ncbi:MAG: protein kinase [Lachnospiraceae bacterium]|nr:protein kinase [Lachnospiraceae bacterium]
MSENVQNIWEKYPAALPMDTILAGEYIIKNVLGQGGFGITYLAEEYRTDAKVAVKEFFPETMAMRSTPSLEVRTYTDERLDNFRFGMNSFLEEAKVLAQFQGNPHIVGVQKYFEENGTAYFVMEYIDGIDFKTYIRQNGGKLPWEEVWKIMSPVMDALDAVHQKCMVHRDVTPDNIFISKDGAVKLLDFGSARYSLGDRSRSLDVVLKPGYAPKEQYTRRGKQGAYTDVYSVAACFYAALSGYLPPESLDRMEEDNLVLLSARGVRLDQTAEDAIIKALEVCAGDRYQTMAEFKQAILAQKPQQAPNNKVKKHFSICNVIAAIIHSYRNGWHMREYDIGVYSGNFENGDMHGYGTIIYSDGDAYSGSWRYGRKSGQGKYVYAGGDIYDGEWSIDKENGQGKYIYANGDWYEGEFKDNEFVNGQGRETYANGDWYEGEFQDGMRNGHGVETYSNGDMYEGKFQDGIKNGDGTYKWADGRTKKITYKDGKPMN